MKVKLIYLIGGIFYFLQLDTGTKKGLFKPTYPSAVIKLGVIVKIFFTHHLAFVVVLHLH